MGGHRLIQPGRGRRPIAVTVGVTAVSLAVALGLGFSSRGGSSDAERSTTSAVPPHLASVPVDASPAKGVRRREPQSRGRRSVARAPINAQGHQRKKALLHSVAKQLPDRQGAHPARATRTPPARSVSPRTGALPTSGPSVVSHPAKRPLPTDRVKRTSHPPGLPKPPTG
jgi:hypothetical protein